MTDRSNPEHPLRGNETPKAHLDELLGGFALDLDRELSAVVDETRRGIDTAREVQVTEGESESMPVLDVRNDGGEVLYGKVKREDVEQWIRTRRDYRYKLVAVSDNLRALRRICDEISRLRGWAQLMSVINTLPSNELADEVRWKQKKLWLDDQFEILKGKADKESEPAEKLESFYLELHDLLVASQGVLLDLRQRGTSETRDDDSETEERHRISFHERLTMTRKLIGEWKALVRQSEMQEEDFRLAVAQKLGKKPEQVLDVREFARELRELGARHHWESEAAKGDKSHVRIKMGHLEEVMPIAREIAATNGQQPLDFTAKLEVGRADLVGKTIAEKESGPVVTFLELEKAMSTLVRKDKELWYRDQTGGLYRVIPTRGDEVFELWYPDGVRVLGHYRELASTLSQIGVVFDGKRTRWQGEFQDPKLRSLSMQDAQSVIKQADGVVLREQEKAMQELERLLKEKLQLFTQLMNERLLQAEPGLSYARRRGRILAQMPEFAELMLQRQSNIVLSSDEREAMIERNTASIEIPK